MRLKKTLLFSLWFLFFLTFTAELVKIVLDLDPNAGHKPLGMAHLFFWSCLLLIELAMAGLSVYFFITHPKRRIRLAVLSLCHFTVILALPMIFNNWSWTCLLYPWPHSLQSFDPATPRSAMVISLFIGFLFVPFVSYWWGARLFCGYLCPHGAFFSETYGRLFSRRPGKFLKLGRIIPPFYLALMAAALIAFICVPDIIEPMRTAQKLLYFITAEFFYFVIGIPLLGGRSYCVLICPMGYFIRQIRAFKRWRDRLKSFNDD
ncbi:4Fe-4S binding protein [Desulfosarcina ovata]|uniref:4Fe-4S binding protein n=1 Tax=Desulfosarcina ovata TaxID=83564 RepID=UPI0012D2DAC3|nr:4Fe-4S binding protein [Desulfosarcina ovata]